MGLISVIYDNCFMKFIKRKKYRNLIEASGWSRLLRKLFGAAVAVISVTPDYKVERKFSLLGFFCYIFWYTLYFYCSYIAIIQDQTILRGLHKSKLKRYGDDYERCSSVIYVLSAMVLTPFRLSGNSDMVKKIVDIDRVIEKSGYNIDYNKIAVTSITVSSGQVFASGIRILCIWLCLKSTIDMPPEKLFQIVFTDAQAIIATSNYIFFLIIIKCKYKWINGVLEEIKYGNFLGNKLFVRNEFSASILKVKQFSNQQACDKIKLCAKVYALLYEGCSVINNCFGLSLLLTMLSYLDYVILYLFYFMEANAVGLFHDLNVYLDFIMFTFWEISISLGVIFLIIHFAERTMKEARRVSFMIHEIINEDYSPIINEQAMQFSTQLLHEIPVFTVCGLFDLNYTLLHQGARSVSTYLVILLQFVTDKNN